LVYIYTLIDVPEKQRVFLIEEPESQLYPALQKRFLEIIIRISTDYRIQLFITTNSDCARDYFSLTETFVIYKPEAGEGAHLHRRPWLQKATNLHLLGIRAKYVLLCEGPSDPLFIRTLAKIFKLDISHVQLQETSSLCASTTVQDLVNNLFNKEDRNNVNVCFLRDPDFRVEHTPNDNEYFWSLPSIESYLFVYYCVHRKDQSPLAFFLEERNQQIFSTKYANSFRSQNRSEDAIVFMFKAWNEAVESAKQPQPSMDHFLAVAKVLHGHTWVEEVLKSKSSDLILALQDDFSNIFPDVGVFLKKIVSENKRN